ncbi:hypothetical protein U1Q18_034328 [Sarracenia purpurea var. burkii]
MIVSTLNLPRSRRNLLLKLVWLLAWLPHLCESASGEGDSYVRNACSVTQYRDLCIRLLAPFSNTAKQNPSRWAMAGVSVTICEAKSVAKYLTKSKRRESMKGRKNREDQALIDCVECFRDAIENLQRSIGVLGKLNSDEFDAQMEDVRTWLSASMTDEDTCLDGFEGEEEGEEVQMLRNKVSNMSCITSNALALVNKLAASGPETLVDP